MTFDPDRLDSALHELHTAGVPGTFAEVRLDDQVWRGAAGVADLATREPATADLAHRVGSATKTFTAAAVLRQVERGTIALDQPVGRYVPGFVPGERGRSVTVRMLLNHTSGLPEYLPYAYPSLRAFPQLAATTPASLDDFRDRAFTAEELIKLGVGADPSGEPGSTPGVYSNTNYLLLGQLLEHVTGTYAEDVIAQDIISPAGLENTFFPDKPQLDVAHSKLYESWLGMFDPPHEFSVFDMSFVGVSASMVSTVADLNRFYALLLAGKIVTASSLAAMQRTVPVISFEQTMIDYGLGLQRKEIPGLGTFWGHDGTVWGGGTISMISADGRRQLSLAVNLQRWNVLGADGRPQPHRIDTALNAFVHEALTPSDPAPERS